MAMQGPDIQALSSKYSSAEVQKFQAIITADNSGNSALAEQLASRLSVAENTKFDEYLADLEKIQQYKEQLGSEYAQAQADITRFDGEIAVAEQKRDLIYTKYQDGIEAAVADFSNGKSNGHTSSSSSAQKW